MSRRVAIFALFAEIPQAEEALDLLTADRFQSDDVSIVMRQVRGARNSGTLGLLSGFGSFELTDTGPVTVAGPARSKLTASKDNARPGLAGALAGLGCSPYDADSFATGIEAGSVLLSVEIDPVDAERARDVLKRAGAVRLVSTEGSKDRSAAPQGWG